MDDRLTEIEIKLAHMEQALNELNDAMVQHSELIDRLSLANEKLKLQLEMQSSGEANPGPEDDKPPHY